ncbi:MAG: PHP domain-containing protein [Armatimonadetes bacterium]|nr:PHP domain-containing protein [Armatimonadota bacterium]
MTTLTADLHIHSVLSPCGQLSMSPRAIAARAVEVGLDVIALADHNCARNAPALAAAVEAAGLRALYGVEARSAEEVDLLVWFDQPEAAVEFGDWLYEGLPPVTCQREVFGDQVVVDADDEIVEFVERLLISGQAEPLARICDEARARGALVVPAHVDRPRESVISQLGWLPDDLEVDAVELSRFGAEEELLPRHPWLARQPIVRFSDAHRLQDIGYQQTWFHVAEATVAEFRAALAGRDGRWARPVRQALKEDG